MNAQGGLLHVAASEEAMLGLIAVHACFEMGCLPPAPIKGRGTLPSLYPLYTPSKGEECPDPLSHCLHPFREPQFLSVGCTAKSSQHTPTP